MEKRTNIHTIRQVEHELHVASYIQECLSQMYLDDEIDPVTMGIVLDTQRLAKLQVNILAATTLRWKELKTLDLRWFLSGSSQRCKQYKTDSYRSIPGLSSPIWLETPDWNETMSFQRLAYDAVRRAIIKATPDHIKRKLADVNDSTHIFRHLRASWMHLHGSSVDEIADFFGHANTESTEAYIHPALYLSGS